MTVINAIYVFFDRERESIAEMTWNFRSGNLVVSCSQRIHGSQWITTDLEEEEDRETVISGELCMLLIFIRPFLAQWLIPPPWLQWQLVHTQICANIFVQRFEVTEYVRHTAKAME